MIHATALIDPTAQLGSDVEVGPYSIIGAGVEIGDNCRIHAHVVILQGVKMGCGNVIHAGAVIGDTPQDLGFSPTIASFVQIGNRNVIRENVTLHRGSNEGSSTRLGDDCFLMAGAHCAHDVQLGNRVIAANNVLLAGHASVGDNAFLGGGCVVHQHTRIGRLAILQGLSGFSKDVPPFTMGAEINMVAGLNSVGLKRAGTTLETRNEIKAAFHLIYRAGLNVSQALAEADTQTWGPETTEFFSFIREAKKRGICALTE